MVHIEGSLFPNQAGTDSKRSITLAGDDLTVSNPTPGSGGRSDWCGSEPSSAHPFAVIPASAKRKQAVPA